MRIDQTTRYEVFVPVDMHDRSDFQPSIQGINHVDTTLIPHSLHHLWLVFASSGNRCGAKILRWRNANASDVTMIPAR